MYVGVLCIVAILLKAVCDGGHTPSVKDPQVQLNLKHPRQAFSSEPAWKVDFEDPAAHFSGLSRLQMFILQSSPGTHRNDSRNTRAVSFDATLCES